MGGLLSTKLYYFYIHYRARPFFSLYGVFLLRRPISPMGGGGAFHHFGLFRYLITPCGGFFCLDVETFWALPPPPPHGHPTTISAGAHVTLSV